MKVLKLLSLFVALLAINAATAQIPLNKNIFKLRSYGDDQLKVRIAGDYVSVAPGKNFRIAFLFDLGAKWYSYSDAKSSSHMPTQIQLQLPDGFKVVKTLWSGACDADHRYTDDFWVVYEIMAPQTLPHQIVIKGSASWQCCDGNLCNTNDVAFELPLKSGKNVKSKLHKLINGFK